MITDRLELAMAIHPELVAMKLVESFGFTKTRAMIQDAYDLTESVVMESACHTVMDTLKNHYISTHLIGAFCGETNTCKNSAKKYQEIAQTFTIR